MRGRRARPHISVKVREIQPSFGVSNAPRAVVRDVVIATPPHSGPYTIFGRLRHSVRRAARGGYVTFQTTARPAAMNDHVSFVGPKRAAVAPATPLTKILPAPSLSLDFFGNDKTAEPFANFRDTRHA